MPGVLGRGWVGPMSQCIMGNSHTGNGHIIGGSLVSLVIACCPRFWEVAGTYEWYLVIS